MKYVSVNSHIIRKNAKHGTKEAPIRIARSKSDKSPIYASSIELIGNSKLIYDPNKPIMSCGARLVIETEDVKVVA